MSFFASFQTDKLLGRVVRNSAHLFSSNAVGLALSVVQGILAARMLGPAGFGIIGIVMSYSSTLNGLLSFRMGELVVRYGGEYLERGEKQKAAALIRAASWAELSVSVVAFAAVALSAALAARFFAKTPGIEWMFVVYGLGLLCNFNTETATGILQITNQIKLRGTVNLIQAVFSTAIIITAVIWNGRVGLNANLAMLLVLVAYLTGKAILGLGLYATGRASAARVLGREWRAPAFAGLPPLKELLGFAFSSNLSATAILVFRESEVLWVGFFLNSEAAGLYKVAYTVVGLLSVPADPLILSVHPEVNRLVVQRAWDELRGLLRKVTMISLAYNFALALGFLLIGHWILGIFGAAYPPAFPAMMAMLAGMVFNYTLLWNRPLLLALGLQAYALGAIILAGALKVGLAIPLVPRFGIVMEASLLSLYYVLSVSLIVWRGAREVRRRMALDGSQPGVLAQVP